METMEAIARRRSVRSFEPRQVPEDVLDRILWAGMRAPVGQGCYDSLHLTVVRDRGLLVRIADASSDMVQRMTGSRKDMDFGAGTVIIVSSKPAVLPGLEYANAACVLENMVLAATDLGVDSLLWGAAAQAVGHDAGLRSDLGIPEGSDPILCASFGYADSEGSPAEHRIPATMVRGNRRNIMR